MKKIVIIIYICVFCCNKVVAQSPLLDSLIPLREDTMVDQVYLNNQIAKECSRIGDSTSNFSYYTYAIFYETESFMQGNDSANRAVSLYNLAYYYNLFGYYTRAAAYIDWAKDLYSSIPEKDSVIYQHIVDFALICDSNATQYYTLKYTLDEVLQVDEAVTQDSIISYSDALFFCAHVLHSLSNDTAAINALNGICAVAQYMSDSVVTQALYELTYYNYIINNHQGVLAAADQYFQLITKNNDYDKKIYDYVVRYAYDVWKNASMQVDSLTATTRNILYNKHVESLFDEAYNTTDELQFITLKDSAVIYALEHHTGDCTPYIEDLLDSAQVLIRVQDFASALLILNRAEQIAIQTSTPMDSQTMALLFAQSMLANYRVGKYDRGWEQECKLMASRKSHEITYSIHDVDMYYKAKSLIMLVNSSVEELHAEGDNIYVYNTPISFASYDNVDYYNYDSNPIKQFNDTTAYVHEHISAEVKIDSLIMGKEQLNGNAVSMERRYMSDLNEVIEQLINKGNYQDAERICNHAIDVMVYFKSKVHESYLTQAVYYMAIISAYNGEWKKATECIEYAYAYYAKTEHSEMLAQLLVLYSEYYQHFGNVQEALRYAELSISICKSIPMEHRNHDKCFHSFINYAKCIINSGNYDFGMELLASLQIYVKEEQGAEHLNMAQIWLEYLNYGINIKNKEAGYTGFVKARDILATHEEELLCNSGLANIFVKDYIDLYVMGAQLFLQNNDNDNALAASETAIKYVIKYYGEAHPYILMPILLQSQAMQKMGNIREYTIKNSMYANQLAQELYGRNHWIVGETQWRLAELALEMQHTKDFEQYVDTIQQIFSHNIRHEFTFLTSVQRAQYWQRQSQILENICTHAIRLLTPTMSKYIYNVSLMTKGMLLKTDVEIANIVAQSRDSTLFNQYMRLIELNNQQQIALERNTSFTQEIEKEIIERTIQQRVLEYGDYTRALEIRWVDVREHLQNDELAIEFLSVLQGDKEHMYCALLLRHDSEYPELIPLFEEKEVSSFLSTSNSNITNQTYDFYSNGDTISQLVWSKIQPKLNKGETIYFAPSGLLHQLAIEHLPYDETLTMSDIYNMVRLSSTREIVLNKQKTEYTTATIYGGIQYNLAADNLVVESEKYPRTGLLATRSIENDTLNRGYVQYLPGTKKEAETINALLLQNNISAQLYTTSKANEESFKSLSGKHNNIIHIGTHGFTWTDSIAKKQDYFTQRMHMQTLDGSSRPTGPIIDPLTRCGLLFAGSNIALSGHASELPEGVQDGILTAKEISLMDLRDADLVVLSACETAKGDITSEGVFGLQRAFKMAGVQTIIMSLWKVNDQATQLLMTEFYNNWIGKHQSKRKAFRNAQNTVRTRYEEPEYWAGFIMLD